MTSILLHVSIIILALVYFIWVFFNKPKSKVGRIKQMLYNLCLLSLCASFFFKTAVQDLLFNLSFFFLMLAQLIQLYFPEDPANAGKWSFKKPLFAVLAVNFLSLSFVALYHLFV